MKLTETALINKVNAMRSEGYNNSAICRACGYSSKKEDGTERLHFVDFYEALIKAKGLDLPQNEVEISEEYRDLYDELCEQYPKDAVDIFLEEFTDDDLESFSDAYYGEYDSEADFAEQFYDEMGKQIPDGIVVDWQATWDSYLSDDYHFEDGYVFRTTW